MTVFTPRYSRKPERKGSLLRRLASRWPGISRQGWGPVFRPRKGVAAPQVRRRKGGLLRPVLLLVLLVLAAGLAGRLGFRVLTRSDIFRLTEVTVTGNTTVDESRLLSLAGLRPGINLLTLDRRAALAGITGLRWIRKAELHVQWPSRVLIQVQEYQPLALVALQEEEREGLYYVARDGTLFAPVQPGQDVDFPVLTGDLVGMGLEEDGIAADSLAGQALYLLRLAGRSNAILPAQAISEIHLDPARGLIVYLVDRPFPIYLGRERIRIRYWRLVRILERLYRKKKIEQIREIRMDYAENRALVAMLPSGERG